jgi:hypothetical protein
MPVQDHAERIAMKLAIAYGLPPANARRAVAEAGARIVGIDPDSLRMRRDGHVVRLDSDGRHATLELPAEEGAPPGDTLDPYGERDDLQPTDGRDPPSTRIPPAPGRSPGERP